MDIRSNKGFAAKSPFNREPVNQIKGNGRITMSRTRRNLIAMDGRQIRTLQPGQEAQFQGNVLEMDPSFLFEIEAQLLEAHLGTLKADDQMEFIEKYDPLPENMKRAALMQIAQMHQDVIQAAAQAMAPQTQSSQEAPPEQEVQPAMKNGGLTKSKAEKMLHDGTVHGKKITDKQRKYFAAVAFAKKQNGGRTVTQFDYTGQAKVPGNSPTDESTREVLKKGSKGAEVLQLQQFLQGKGFYKGEQDSIYGPKTPSSFGSRIGYQTGGAYEQVQAPTDGFKYTGIVPNKLNKDNTIDLSKAVTRKPRANAAKTSATDNKVSLQSISDQELKMNYDSGIQTFGVADPVIIDEMSRRGLLNARPTTQVDPFYPFSATTEAIHTVTGRPLPPPMKTTQIVSDQRVPVMAPGVMYNSNQVIPHWNAQPVLPVAVAPVYKQVAPTPAFSEARLNWNYRAQHSDAQVQKEYPTDSPFRGNESSFVNRKK